MPGTSIGWGRGFAQFVLVTVLASVPQVGADVCPIGLLPSSVAAFEPPTPLEASPVISALGANSGLSVVRKKVIVSSAANGISPARSKIGSRSIGQRVNFLDVENHEFGLIPLGEAFPKSAGGPVRPADDGEAETHSIEELDFGWPVDRIQDPSVFLSLAAGPGSADDPADGMPTDLLASQPDTKRQAGERVDAPVLFDVKEVLPNIRDPAMMTTENPDVMKVTAVPEPAGLVLIVSVVAVATLSRRRPA